MSLFAEHSLSKEEIARFSRQLILKGLGPAGQERLRDTSVLIIGAGGLGCPLAIYLAAAGVGKIGIVDHDVVSLDNLHRQILHDENRVGHSKVESLKESLLRLNSSISVSTNNVLLTDKNVLDIVNGYSVVADCSDNVATRYLLNDACVFTGKPLVSGSALGWEGQLTVYNCGSKCPCYRCIFPVPPSPDAVTSCSEGGVLGPVVGVIGSMQALEVIKIAITGDSSFAGNLWLFDGFDGRTRTICLRDKISSCAVCGKNPTVQELQDYKLFCGSGPTDKVCSLSLLQPEDRATVQDYSKLREGNPPVLLDVRPPLEYEICHLPEAKNVSLDELKKLDISAILRKVVDDSKDGGELKDQTVYVVCHRGNDSQLAVILLREKLAASGVHQLQFRDLIGGLDSWAAEVDDTFPRY